MFKNRLSPLLFRIVFPCVILISLCSWGVWGHKHINKAAVFALPPEMRTFFYNHVDFVTEEAVIPDIRKYTMNDKTENPRHFVDLENFGGIDSLPLTMKEATQKYDSVFLQKNGILPWYVQTMMEKLTKAFRDGNSAAILLLASDLGHYLGDAHMPLHTSVNYDGQLTDQKGIHAFWESHLPEVFGETYNLYVGEAKYIDNIQKETWRIIQSSHHLVDTVLITERNLRKSFPEDKVYKKDSNGKPAKNKYNNTIHSSEYAQQFHAALKGMVEKQMKASISATADYWFTAWVNAGKPDLSSLDDNALTKRNKKLLKEDLETWKKGKVNMLKVDNEF